MSDLDRVLVLAGGLSYEREVSLHSGRRVVDALRTIGVEAELADVDPGLLPALTADPPSAIFIALHGATGEDGAIRDVLDLMGLPYVGSDAAACRLAFDKPSAKAAVRAAGLLTPGSVALPHATFRELGASVVLDRIVERLGLPLMVKPARGGSALGAGVVRTREELPSAMVGCFSYGEVALVEAFVTGVEVAVSVIDTGSGPVALPATEITPLEGAFDYAARYTAGMTEYHCPARLTPEEASAAADAALTAHRALGLRDLSRTDLIVADGVAHFLEVNVSPGMTETSLLPLSADAADIDLGTLCRDLLQQAAGRA
ncbi:MAG TPA: D-alanine--D-alanine ligase [Mycobacteriales bacterium]|jgi:D-alanine-D-alanine ligase|nr:D-alanine--D-alanine ligase [Mycobacteriales bacterium]